MCALAPLGTRWPLVPLSFPPLCSLQREGSGHPEGWDPGSRQCVPRDQAPQLGEHKRQRPLMSWRLLGTPEAHAALLQPRLERAMIRLACFLYTRHIHT